MVDGLMDGLEVGLMLVSWFDDWFDGGLKVLDQLVGLEVGLIGFPMV